MKEEDIRPADLFRRYLEITRKDIRKYFGNRETFKSVRCVSCGKSGYTVEFVKYGFRYCKCDHCGCLYVNPRPPERCFMDYYRESATSKFWADHFYRETEKNRRKLVYRPKAKRIKKLFHKHYTRPIRKVVDVGAGAGLMLEELRGIGTAENYYAIEPSLYLSKLCRDKGFVTEMVPVEKAPSRLDRVFDCAVSMELLEHLYSPGRFLKSVNRLLKPGGLFAITTLNNLGFDMLVLGKHSNSISPPHHINFFSPRAFEALLEKNGFEMVECITPGLLDVDIVRNAVGDGMIKPDGFLQYLLSDAELSGKFQKFLIRNRMSSHIWALARKKVK